MHPRLKIFGLFFLMTLLFMGIGFTIGSYFAGTPLIGTSIFLLLILIINLVSYFFSDRIVLRSYRARIVNPAEAPRLYSVVERVAGYAEVPVPRVATIPSNTPNAFATGRNPRNAVVAATEGLLHVLDDAELEGVIAHEMAHVKNRDILVMTVAATMAGIISFAARMFLWNSMFGGRRNGNILLFLAVAVLAAVGAMAIRMAISRSREYKADATGAAFIGNPLALASALDKLEYANRHTPMRLGSPVSSSLFITNPFAGRGGFLNGLFSTHPPMEERIRRLQGMVYGY